MSAAEDTRNDVVPVQIGDIVDGKFRIERVIGEGAIGMVVEATHIELDQRVAIKFLRPSEKARRDQVIRFAREARAAVRLKGEHVARILDVGELPGGDPYMVMELLEGRDLEQHISQSGPILNLAAAALYMIQACEALAEAHSLGIVHRDIKPANLFLFERPGMLPMVKLLDFGISKAAITGQYTNIALEEAKTTTIMGTPYYMSPEQVRSTKDVDRRADVWALGAVMFELVTGQLPWKSDELGSLVQEILSQEPRSILDIRPDVGAQFALALGGALQKDPTTRYASAAEFAQALLPFAPPTAQVHVERAQSYSTVSERSLPALSTSRRSLTSSRTSLTASSTGLLSEPPPPSGGSRVFKAAIGISLLIVVGTATALIVPRLTGGSAAPVATSDPSANAPPPVNAPPPIKVVVPPPATTTAQSTAPKAGDPAARAAVPPPVAWQPRKSGAAAAPATPGAAAAPRAADPAAPATPPPPSTAGPGRRPAMDDNPWTKTDRPRMDDNPIR